MGGYAMEIIKCEKLKFTYPLSNRPALNGVNFTIEDGEFCLVMGKSASGKSTLLKLLKKEIAPAGTLDGTICVNAFAGYVGQNIEENIVCNKVRSELAFALTASGRTYDEIETAIAETASYFHLENRLESDISTLSGGEKQIVNLAAVMIMRPEILILDEPTAQLDPIWSEKFLNIIKKLHKDFSTAILIAEHNCKLLFEYADSIVLLEDSACANKKTPTQMIKHLKDSNSTMLWDIPIGLHLFDKPCTTAQCRQFLKEKNIASLTVRESTKKQAALSAKRLCFSYEKGRDILKDLSIEVYEQKINAVVGPNGGGKTTLLKTLAGVRKSYRGKIKSTGKISMLCQNVFDLFTHDKCSEEVNFGEITDFLQISDIADIHPYDLSGGQAQRLALAMVLEKNADIILLDEPTKGLDSDLKIKLAGLLSDLCAKGKTILMVSHDIEFAGAYCDYISFLSQGRIITTRPRQTFFSNLNFYTTDISKLTNKIADNIVSYDDLRLAGGTDE